VSADPLTEAIDLLAASYQVALRAGADTNWPAIRESLRRALASYNRNGATARTYRLPGVALRLPDSLDLIHHLHRQRAFSERTFGPGPRLAGILDHLRKELREVEANPADISEWIDLVLLAFDGAWRQGFTPEQIAAALTAKQIKNEARTWPDWRTIPDGKAIEHDRSATP
jgi:hypothetical protein